MLYHAVLLFATKSLEKIHLKFSLLPLIITKDHQNYLKISDLILKNPHVQNYILPRKM